MWKTIAACLCITVASPFAMASELEVDMFDPEQTETIDASDAKLDTTNEHFASLRYFSGDWRCLGSGEVSGGANLETILHIYGTLHHWYAIEGITFGTVRTESTSYLTYSPHKQAFIEIGVTDHGAYSRGKGTGWEKGALVLTGYTHLLDREGHHWRKTLSKIDETHFTFQWEISTDGETYSIVRQATCSK